MWSCSSPSTHTPCCLPHCPPLPGGGRHHFSATEGLCPTLLALAHPMHLPHGYFYARPCICCISPCSHPQLWGPVEEAVGVAGPARRGGTRVDRGAQRQVPCTRRLYLTPTCSAVEGSRAFGVSDSVCGHTPHPLPFCQWQVLHHSSPGRLKCGHDRQRP